MKNPKPNIFKLATKELSQDSFLAWLLQWADYTHKHYDPDLNETAKDFVRQLIGQDQDYQVIKVKAGRQWHNVDVWAEVNEEYFLCIEDKTNTCEHSEQLERYKNIAVEHYKDKNHKLAFVYLKTGNESSVTLNEIVKKGYLIISRKDVLNVLNKREIQNEIFTDFKEYLATIETITNSYTKFDKLTSEGKAAEGFYMKLQELIPEWTDWRYVSNQMGGFLGFWYHWTRPENYSLYIQIENAFDRGIKVVIKIGDWESNGDWKPNTDTLKQIFYALQPYSKKYGLAFERPDKYRAGKTSTLAIIGNTFKVDGEDNIDLEQFIATLKNIEQMLDEYSSDKTSQTNMV